ncbi:MAG: N-acyl-D-amino-acid deacylase family protein [Chakrabartia sp.]
MADFDLVIRNGTLADGSGGDLQETDVAIKDGRIAALGKVAGNGAEEIDARHRLVTPGFVDVHTHYDGQAIWSDTLAPSSAHGVTTAILGNCGVGFAPCRREDQDMLINVMEGVEDIPGVVMAEGLPWDWETFPDYLNRLEAGRRDIDVAAYLPHSPLRVYVMGARGARQEPATAEDLARMRALTQEAMAAGAIGFATSRLSIHKTADGGAIPTYDADVRELAEICAGMKDAGTGTLQIVLDAFRGWDKEYPIIDQLVAASGRPATFTLASGNEGPPAWRRVLDLMAQTKAAGGQVTAQVMPRPIGLIGGLELSVHPFIMCPSWQKIAALPLAQKVAAMRDPALRQALLSETPDEGHPFNALGRNWRWMFPLDNPPDYAPPPEKSFAAMAAARGVTPEEIAYDRFLATEGKGLILAALGNFEGGTLDAAYEMLTHPDCVPGLGDGGAHYGAICDASYSTYLLQHWVRDAKSDQRIDLAQAVHMLSAKAARAVGLRDRGVIRLGAKADLNVIDMDRLTIALPDIVHDLPAGGRRLNQRATGYEATIVSGSIIRRYDEATAARPGRLVRGAQG